MRQASEGFVQPELADDPDAEIGLRLRVHVTSPGGLRRLMSEERVWVVPPAMPEVPPPPARLRILNVSNEIDLRLEAIVFDEEPTDLTQGQRILVRHDSAIGVGWIRFEMFGPPDIERWNLALTREWAQADILSEVAKEQLRAQGFRELDPNADARRQAAALLDAYTALLDSAPREEELQQFLHSNPSMLAPTHVRMWPKLALGARVTDFVFRQATGDYLLVELEKSSKRLFRKDGDRTADLNHAMDQVTTWWRYLEDNLSTVQRELGLTDISVNPAALVVIGRSADLTPANRRLLTTIEQANPRLRIMTYDDVAENAKAVWGNVLGSVSIAGPYEVYLIPTDANVPD